MMKSHWRQRWWWCVSMFVLLICLVVVVCAHPHHTGCTFQHIVRRPAFVSSCCIHPLEQPVYWYSVILILDRFLHIFLPIPVSPIISRHFVLSLHISTVMTPVILATLNISIWFDGAPYKLSCKIPLLSFFWPTSTKSQALNRGLLKLLLFLPGETVIGLKIAKGSTNTYYLEVHHTLAVWPVVTNKTIIQQHRIKSHRSDGNPLE